MLPNLIVIGAQKCGTTSLHFYLSRHPQIYMARLKELHYFIEERNWRRGVGWYERQFPVDAAVRGETTPAYTNHPAHPDVPARMHGLVPDARLIYLVRDPIDRIVSQYVHFHALGWERRSLEAAVGEGESSQYVARSRYAMQLEQFLAHYPRERVLILSDHDLLRRRAETLRETFRWLGVDEAFTSPRFETRLNPWTSRRRLLAPARLLYDPRVRASFSLLPPAAAQKLRYALSYPFSSPAVRPIVSSDLRERLTAALAEDVARFRALTGREFAEWSV